MTHLALTERLNTYARSRSYADPHQKQWLAADLARWFAETWAWSSR